MVQLLAHEITHCVMFQAVGSEATWRNLGVPLWFQEGMASVAAGQDHGSAVLQTIWSMYGGSAVATSSRAAAMDPLVETGSVYQTDSDLAYATAHMAFRFLLEREGAERIHHIVSAMRKGTRFREAFERSTGIAVQDFEDEFRHYVASGRLAQLITASPESLAGIPAIARIAP